MEKLFISLASLMFLFSCSHQSTNQDLSYKVDSNEYWNALAESISKDDENGLQNYLAKNNPKLLNQIELDSKDPYLLMFWGRSSNEDASNKKTIVDEKILNQIYKKFNFYQSGEYCHAGIIHSYGYLFSKLMTPYGYKRKRWIDHSLNYAFSFSQESLSPQAKDGSLLSNLTYFIGMITLKNKTSLQLLKNVSQEILRFDYEALKVSRLEEKVDHVVIRTFFVSFPKFSPQDENRYLLIYTIEDLKMGKESLITAFPVNEKTFVSSQAALGLGKNKLVTLRYNALLENFPSNALGTRTFIKNQ